MASNNIDLWGWQVEAGSVTTPFTPAGGGSPQAELALCQRYYQFLNPVSTYQDLLSGGSADSTAYCRYPYNFPVVMRGAPTIGTTGKASHYMNLTSSGAWSASAVPSLESSRPTGVSVILYSGGFSAGAATFFRNSTSTLSSFLTFSAEL